MNNFVVFFSGGKTFKLMNLWFDKETKKKKERWKENSLIVNI